MTVGVRWQQEMEDFLSVTRALTGTGLKFPDQPERAAAMGALAQANATAALALATANGLSDIQDELAALRDAIRDDG